MHVGAETGEAYPLAALITNYRGELLLTEKAGEIPVTFHPKRVSGGAGWVPLFSPASAA